VAAACGLAILAMVARLQPVAACMALQLCPDLSIDAIPALRATSSTRPLYLPSALALACPTIYKHARALGCEGIARTAAAASGKGRRNDHKIRGIRAD
jgi:hypothetical protein